MPPFYLPKSLPKYCPNLSKSVHFCPSAQEQETEQLRTNKRKSSLISSLLMIQRTFLLDAPAGTRTPDTRLKRAYKFPYITGKTDTCLLFLYLQVIIQL